jgi:hypothetical protein
MHCTWRQSVLNRNISDFEGSQAEPTLPDKKGKTDKKVKSLIKHHAIETYGGVEG